MTCANAGAPSASASATAAPIVSPLCALDATVDPLEDMPGRDLSNCGATLLARNSAEVTRSADDTCGETPVEVLLGFEAAAAKAASQVEDNAHAVSHPPARQRGRALGRDARRDGGHLHRLP